jgi:hypothetical protein
MDDGVHERDMNGSDGISFTPATRRRTTDANVKHLFDGKKLEQEIQLLKIQLNQRDLLIENQKIRYQEKCEDLKEKLADMTFQRQMLQTKLESQLQVNTRRQRTIDRNRPAVLVADRPRCDVAFTRRSSSAIVAHYGSTTATRRRQSTSHCQVKRNSTKSDEPHRAQRRRIPNSSID